MVAIDTNVLVRFLVGDNPSQYKASYNLIANEQEVFIADSVVLETEWVLRYAYEFEPDEVCDAFRRVFGLPNVTLANGQLVAQVISCHESGLDFADAFHLALSQESDSLKTFDGDFIKRAKSLNECRVERP